MEDIESHKKSIAEELQLLATLSTRLFILHRESEDTKLVSPYREKNDYDWKSSICHGFLSQIQARGEIYNYKEYMSGLTGFAFINSTLSKMYFPNPDLCTLFIASLYAEQRILDLIFQMIELQKKQHVYLNEQSEKQELGQPEI